MSRHPTPFNSRIVQFESLMAGRVQAGNPLSLMRAISEVLDDPDFRAASDTLVALNGSQPNGKQRAGRKTKYFADLMLAILAVALISGQDMRGARNLMASTDTLRQRYGYAPLTPEQQFALAAFTGGAIKESDFPTEGAIDYFVQEWTSIQCPQFLDIIEAATLRVAADIIDRFDVDCGWLATDGTRVRAATNEPTGANPDEGAAVFARTRSEDTFNQRHVHPVVLSNLPVIVSQLVTPPKAEITAVLEEGLPKLAAAGVTLGNQITERRIARGVPEAQAHHRGFHRSALASDRFLANEPGIRAVISHGFFPASMHPESRPTYRGTRIVVLDGSEHMLDIRTDRAVLCPCTRGGDDDHRVRGITPGRRRPKKDRRSPAHSRPPMLIQQHEFGRKIRVRCTDPTCRFAQRKITLSLRGPDRNGYAPGTSASLGEWNPDFITQLPVWDDRYIAQRFLALQRVEWVHAQFERLFGLGAKNPSFKRRKISGTHRNRVWWAVACLIWNITLRNNLVDGRTTITDITRDKVAITKVVDNFWNKDRQIRSNREKARARRQARERSADRRRADQAADPPPDELPEAA